MFSFNLYLDEIFKNTNKPEQQIDISRCLSTSVNICRIIRSLHRQKGELASIFAFDNYFF